MCPFEIFFIIRDSRPDVKRAGAFHPEKSAFPRRPANKKPLPRRRAEGAFEVPVFIFRLAHRPGIASP